MPFRLVSRRLWLLAWALAVTVAGPGAARPEKNETPSGFERVPRLRPPPKLMAGLIGRPVLRVEVVTVGARWVDDISPRRVRAGDPLSPELARRAMAELSDTGRFAAVRAEVEPLGAGVLLRLVVTPRRVAGAVKLIGGSLDEQETLRALDLDTGSEVTAQSLDESAARLRRYYAEHGFPDAVVRVDAVDTDDPLRVLILLEIDPGSPRPVTKRVFVVSPKPDRNLEAQLESYTVAEGDRVDEDALSRADDDLAARLKVRGWHRAEVTHRLESAARATKLLVLVKAGSRLRVVLEGNRSFDSDDLEQALELETANDRTPEALSSRLRTYYQQRGFFDVEVTAYERGGPKDPVHDLVLRIRENARVRVVAREFPCLSGDRSADDVGTEIDGFLSETLPGTGLFGPVDGETLDGALGPTAKAGARVTPLEQNPWNTFVPDVYDRALHHVQELYRSEGYLSAVVGPVAVLRRACDPRSPPGRCIPIGDRLRPPATCPANDVELPVEDPAPPASTACAPDPTKGVRCEPEVVLQIPIKLGPRALLWDVAFDGNDILVERELAEAAKLELGQPVSQVELEKARLRVLDQYAELGFAFASVEVHLEMSPDRTRARARFVIGERERVRVKDIVIRGARRTNESLILGRVALERGGLYRRSEVRDTEERLATLGVFSSITVTLEDPDVPAREKVVVITVVERAPQYLDVRPGFSTGDGVRVTFEYGHRNLGGEAIQLTLRVQLGYLPDVLILDEDVRENFAELDLGDRLERRNTASIELPEIGLGPLFRFGVDAVDVRDNARDFGLTKDAGILTLSYRPSTRFTMQLGGSLERNDARIFGTDEQDALAVYLRDNPGARGLLLVPQGTTVAVAERVILTLDLRDNPFGATKGSFVSGGVEHVRAYPVGDNATSGGVGETIDSQFLRVTNRFAGYARFTDAGLSLALSFRWGINVQLFEGSQTYPDRLFFFGGVDSIRGFLQDSVIPQDIAERIEATADLPDDDDRKLTEQEVVIRGGDFVMNPRAELRIPLGGVWATALFLDTGNLWVEPENIAPEKLRYAAGSGLRATTPIGPLALDVGVNLDRRQWEDPFAFHFSIGLF